MYRLTKRTYLNADRSRVVEESDPAAAVLLGNVGAEVSDYDAKRLGLTGEAVEKYDPPAQTQVAGTVGLVPSAEDTEAKALAAEYQRLMATDEVQQDVARLPDDESRIAYDEEVRARALARSTGQAEPKPKVAAQAAKAQAAGVTHSQVAQQEERDDDPAHNEDAVRDDEDDKAVVKSGAEAKEANGPEVENKAVEKPAENKSAVRPAQSGNGGSSSSSSRGRSRA